MPAGIAHRKQLRECAESGDVGRYVTIKMLLILFSTNYGSRNHYTGYHVEHTGLMGLPSQGMTTSDVI
jgi:hypothetical protein